MKLNAAARKSLPTSSFALPDKATTPQGKVTGGSYPVDTANRARNALSRVSQFGNSSEKQKVKNKVKKKYPQIKQGGVSGYLAKKNII